MITIQNLEWSNFFSYGDNNYIDFDKTSLTQIKGVNGVGKSSIPLIIEEVLFGKNSKGCKKADIVNRLSGKTEISATLNMLIDGDQYTVSLNRKSTNKLTLIKNGIDISEHTATNTYKTLKELIGLDFKTFSQLVYQSSTSSLEFLTSTDTQRKKFLATLFGLDKYTELYEVFRKLYNNTNLDISRTKGSIDTLTNLLSNANKDLASLVDINTEKEEVEELDTSKDNERLAELTTSIKDIDTTNSRINNNNQYKKLKLEIDNDLLIDVEKPVEPKKEKEEIIATKERIKQSKAIITKVSSLKGNCPTCRQEVPEEEKEKIITKGNSAIEDMNQIIEKNTSIVNQYESDMKKYLKHSKAKDEFEKLSNYIDDNLPEDILSKEDLIHETEELKEKINKATTKYKQVIANNAEIDKNIAKLERANATKDNLESSLVREEARLGTLTKKLNRYNILKDALGTNGLISYKLEYLTKDLEDKINKYLSELSGGRFHISFILNKEKLDIEIWDNGSIISVGALSAGELSRVNISTLLAIRELMSVISKTKVNILFLDEILGVMDADGKDKLSMLLLEKEDLNTFLVAHDWTHPLLESVHIIKENGISRIEDK